MSDKLAAWDVREEDFPRAGTLFDRLKFVLRYAVLAPSGPNTQPWKLSIEGSVVSLIADFTRSLPSLDPTRRTLYISHGCLLANTLIAAEHFGFGYEVKCLPDGLSGERTAAIRFSEKAAEHRFPDLFLEITKRHTNRKPYEDRAIDEETLKVLKDCVYRKGFRLDIVSGIEGKNEIAEILARAQKIQLGNKEMRKELAAWVRPNNSDAMDGLPGYSFGYSDFESFLGAFLFATFDMSSSRARIETANIISSPAVGVISTDSDDVLTWIRTGVLLETLFLAATKMDVRFDLFSQPIAIPELRHEMALMLKSRYPQMLIRMGYAQPSKHTPRQPVEDVLVS